MCVFLFVYYTNKLPPQNVDSTGHTKNPHPFSRPSANSSPPPIV